MKQLNNNDEDLEHSSDNDTASDCSDLDSTIIEKSDDDCDSIKSTQLSPKSSNNSETESDTELKIVSDSENTDNSPAFNKALVESSLTPEQKRTLKKEYDRRRTRASIRPKIKITMRCDSSLEAKGLS